MTRILALTVALLAACGASPPPDPPMQENRGALTNPPHPVLRDITREAKFVVHIDDFDPLIGAFTMAMPQMAAAIPAECGAEITGWIETLTVVSVGRGSWSGHFTGPIASESASGCAEQLLGSFGELQRASGALYVGDSSVFVRGPGNARLELVSQLTHGANTHVWADLSDFAGVGLGDRLGRETPSGIDPAAFREFLEQAQGLGVGLRREGADSASLFAVVTSTREGAAAGERVGRQAQAMALSFLRENQSTEPQAFGAFTDLVERMEIQSVEQPPHTSIEVATDVAGIGMIAGIAIPSYINYIKRAKSSEAAANLRVMAEQVNSYYALTGHLPAPAGPLPLEPSAERQAVDWRVDPVFALLGFAPAGPVYYSYSIIPSTTEAGAVALQARGDLDGDEQQSLFEITVGRCTPDAGCVTSEQIYVEDSLE